MLKKLFKYDFTAISKSLWLFTALAILITAAGCGVSELTRAFDASNIPDELEALLIMATVFTVIICIYAVIGYYVLALIMILVRYYKNLFTDEGYLTFTLPVRVTDILNSKLLAGFLWTAIATTVELGCVYSIVLFWMYNGNVSEFIEYNFQGGTFILGGFDSIMFDYGMGLWESLLCSAFDGIITIAFSILLIYLSITFATVIAKKARVFLGIVFFFGISGALSTIMFLITVIFGTTFNGGDQPILTDVEFAYLRYAIKYVFYGGASVGAYFLNRHLLKNKLNLL